MPSSISLRDIICKPISSGISIASSGATMGSLGNEKSISTGIGPSEGITKSKNRCQ